ncbi:MAG: acetate--CoA ligase family protein [Candidatus Asgardarchaeia archaeon]|nr:MAG: CoA-binding protein [Candidatus Asgardarchaeum californiense]
MKELDCIFNAKSVAVIGASRTPGKLGYEILKNIIDANYSGKLYPVNPKADEILGLKAYKSVTEIPEPVDLAVIVIPARFVPDTVRECGKKGIRGIVVISGGFGEVGNKELEDDLVKAVKEYGIRMIGPNCQGINNPKIGLNASWPMIKAPGVISIASQSGTFFATLQMWAKDDNVGVSKCAALGNKLDVDFDDLVEYYGADPDTKVIAIYMEGVRNGKRFVDAARKVTKNKPVIVLKGGRTELGARAVASHTRSLAGKDQIFDAAFIRSRIIRVQDLEELYDTAKAFATLPIPKGNRLLIVTSSGGSGILATDEASERGLDVPLPSESLVNILKEKVPDYVILRNPLDLTGNAYSELYQIVLSEALKTDEYDAVVAIFGDPISGAADLIGSIVKQSTIPIAIVYLGGGDVQFEEKKKFESMGIPVYPTAERAVRALANMVKYSQLITKKQ